MFVCRDTLQSMKIIMLKYWNLSWHNTGNNVEPRRNFVPFPHSRFLSTVLQYESILNKLNDCAFHNIIAKIHQQVSTAKPLSHCARAQKKPAMMENTSHSFLVLCCNYTLQNYTFLLTMK